MAIDKLEIEIESNADKAAKSVRKLTASIKDLMKTNTGGAGLSKINTEIKKIKDTVSKAIPTEQFKKIGKSIEPVTKAIGDSHKKIGGLKKTISTDIPTFKPLVESISSVKKPLDSVSKIAKRIRGAFGGIGDSGQSAFSKLLNSASTAKSSFCGFKSIISRLSPAFRAAGGAASTLKIAISGLSMAIPGVRALRRSVMNVADSFDHAGRRVGFFKTWMGKALKTILIYRALRRTMTEVARAFRDGLRNIVQFCIETQAAMNSLVTDAMLLRNSLGSLAAPIMQQLAPAFEFLANVIHRAVTALGMLFALLGGQDTFVRATRSAKVYGDAISGAGAAAARAKKDFQGAFDELNVLNDSAGGGGGAGSGVDISDMFEEVEIPQNIRDLLDQLITIFEPVKAAFEAILTTLRTIWNTIKEVFQSDIGKKFVDALWRAWVQLWGVIKDIADAFTAAWNEAGRGKALVESLFKTFTTMLNIVGDIAEAFRNVWTDAGYGVRVWASLLEMFTSISDLVRSIGDSFRVAFNDGTGERIIANILQTFIYVNDTIKAIANNLRAAWNHNMNGVAIWSEILGIAEKLTKTIRSISGATAEWARNLNFTSAVNSFRNLLSAIRPVVETLLNGFAWAWKNILLPFGKWTIERALPATLDLLAGAFRAITSVLQAFQPLANWLWNNFLQPIASWTGGAIVSTLSALGSVLSAIGDWVNRNKPIVQGMTVIVAGFWAAWKAGAAITIVLAKLKGYIDAVRIATMLYKDGVAMSSVVAAGASKSQAILGGVMAGKVGILALVKAAWAKLTAVMLANPIGAILVAIAALAAGIAFLVSRTRNQTDEQIALTNETKRLREEYDKLRDSVANSARAHSDRINTYRTETAAAGDLLTSLERLIEADDGTVESRQRIADAVRRLNSALGEEIVMYDKVTGTMNRSISQIESYINVRLRQLEVIAMEERYIELIQERINYERKVAEATDNLNAMLGDQADRYERLLQRYREGGITSSQFALQVRNLSQELGYGRHGLTEMINVHADYVRALDGSNESVEQWGQLMIEASESAVEATSEIEQAQQDMMKTLCEMTNSFTEFSEEAVAAFEAAKDSGEIFCTSLIANFEDAKAATQELERVQAEAMQGMVDRYNDAEQVVRRAYQDMANSSEEQLAEIRQNHVEHELMMAQAAMNIAANLNTLADEMGAAIDRGVNENVIAEMKKMAKENPMLAQAMVDDMDWVFAELAPSVEKRMMAVGELGRHGLEGAELELYDAANDTGRSITLGVAQGVADNHDLPLTEVLKMSDATILGLYRGMGYSSPSTYGIEAGASIPAGVSRGITQNQSSAINTIRAFATSLVNTMRTAIGGNNATVFQNEIGAAMIRGIVQGITQEQSRVGETLMRMMDNVRNAMTARLPEFLNFGRDVIARVITGMQSEQSRLVSTASNIMREKMNAMLNVINSTAPQVINAITNMMNSMVNTINSYMSTFWQLGQSLMINVRDGINATIGTVSSAMRNAINNANSAARSEAGNHMWNLGRDMMQGLANGIRDNAGLVATAMRNAVRDAINAGRNQAQSMSPSRVTMALGKDLMLGGAIGIIDNAKFMIRAMSDAMKDVLDTTSNFDMFESIGDSIKDATKSMVEFADTLKDIDRMSLATSAIFSAEPIQFQQRDFQISESFMENFMQNMYDTMVSANSAQDSNDRPINLTVKTLLDGKEIYTSMERVEQDRGEEIFSNSVLFGLA